MMSKSELIQKIADECSVAKKDVKAVIESLAIGRLQGTEEGRRVRAARLRQVRGDQEAGHQGALRASTRSPKSRPCSRPSRPARSLKARPVKAAKDAV